ncbi:hypothetical protein [Corynebacterium sp.]|uniref:hypothetical protein n=1 Tax=Corynebacterium sp. TaxID=1720 RepID=UPI0026DA85FD|nr:hypothetical protein [Corynebacterium sp.]
MALTLSLDVTNCTFAELSAFVRSLEAAGIKPHGVLKLEGSSLVAVIDAPGQRVSESSKSATLDPLQLGDAALSSLIDVLKSKRNNL